MNLFPLSIILKGSGFYSDSKKHRSHPFNEGGTDEVEASKNRKAISS